MTTQNNGSGVKQYLGNNVKQDNSSGNDEKNDKNKKQRILRSREDWILKHLSGEFKLRYWGGASKVNIRTIDIYRQYKIRICKECDTSLRVYDGSPTTRGHTSVTFRIVR